MYIQKIIFIIAFCIYTKLIFLTYKYVFAKIMIYSSRFIVFIWHDAMKLSVLFSMNVDMFLFIILTQFFW